MTAYPNPLVAEIGDRLEAVDGMVDNVVAFTLAIAAERLRRLPIDDAYLDGQRNALANLIDPSKEQP